MSDSFRPSTAPHSVPLDASWTRPTPSDDESPVQGSLDFLRAAADAFADDARALNTRRAYRVAVATFDAFAARHHVPALPASPDLVAAYLAHLATSGRKVTTIEVALSAIAQCHRDAGHASPRDSRIVRQVLRGIRRRIGVAADRKVAITPLDLDAIVSALPDTPSGRRDRALLFLAFAAGLRRSEVAALTVDDVTVRETDVAIRLRRSKTDQEGAGRSVATHALGTTHVLSDVLAAWVADLGRTIGPLFVAMTRSGRPTSRALSPQSVALIVKRAAALVGLDVARVAGHSLRAGFVTAAVAAGIDDRTIRRTTGHRSFDMMERYVR